MVSIYEPIPKRPCTTVKHCALCIVQEHGGVHVTHNTLDCCKYDKDGKLKKSFGKGQHGSTASDKNKKTASAFAQLLAKIAKIAKLEKANEKLKKSSRKRKHSYSNNSNDSDSS